MLTCFVILCLDNCERHVLVIFMQCMSSSLSLGQIACFVPGRAEGTSDVVLTSTSPIVCYEAVCVHSEIGIQ